MHGKRHMELMSLFRASLCLGLDVFAASLKDNYLALLAFQIITKLARNHIYRSQ